LPPPSCPSTAAISPYHGRSAPACPTPAARVPNHPPSPPPLAAPPAAPPGIRIFIVDRLTTVERAFSTPSPRLLGQSARASPAILVHAEAARTCVFSSSSLDRCGSPRRVLPRACVRALVCARARARVYVARARVHRGRGFSIRERGCCARGVLYPWATSVLFRVIFEKSRGMERERERGGGGGGTSRSRRRWSGREFRVSDPPSRA